MTKKEAETKWCPMKKFKGTCEVSDCMWWAWEIKKDVHDPDFDQGYCGAINCEVVK